MAKDDSIVIMQNGKGHATVIHNNQDNQNKVIIFLGDTNTYMRNWHLTQPGPSRTNSFKHGEIDDVNESSGLSTQTTVLHHNEYHFRILGFPKNIQKDAPLRLKASSIGYVKIQSCRLLHGKCARTAFTRELLTYINRVSQNTVQSTFHAVICLFHNSWDFHPLPYFHLSFGTTNVKICFYSFWVQKMF